MQNEIKNAALEYAARGWHVFPAPKGEKKSHKSAEHSGGRKWGATTDPCEIDRDWKQWPQANVGIVTGPKSGFFVIEADTEAGHGVDGIANLAELIETHDPLPDTIEALSPSGSWHVYFRWPEGYDIPNSQGQVAAGVDVRGDGGMVIGVPSVKPGATQRYRWKNPPGLFDLAECPDWLLQLCLKPAPKLSELAMPRGPAADHYDVLEDTFAGANSTCVDEVDELLSYIPPDCSYGHWLSVLMALHEWSGGSQEGLSIADAWSSRGNKYKPGEVAEKWKGFDTSGGTNWATVPALARANGADLSAIARTHKAKGNGATSGHLSGPEGPEPRSFEELLEAAEALEPGQIKDMEAIVAETVGLNPMRRDMIFRAIKDATGVPLGTIRAQLSQERDAIPEPDHLDLARMTLDAIGRANVICADAFVWRWQDRGVWTQQDDRAIKQAVQARLDAEDMIDVTATLVNGVTDVFKNEIYKPEHQFNLGNPEAVNCLNGELALDEFVGWHLEPHCRENYRTTQIPVTYDPQADAPMFRGFLGQVFRDDHDRDDKISAVLELMGYTLMSHARHEKFVMLIGPGANGKSVLLAVLEGLLGSENVAGVQPANFDNRFQRAHLHQKLANIVTELKQGEVIADAELKAITSGEPATVEHKHKDPFVLRPFATCWFGTNHMPHTRDFSEALFRRATIPQFNRTFAKEEQDPQLKDKLQAELPGILNMCLDAYARAVSDGFTEPQSSNEAKKEWRLEADQVALFVDEACRREPGARTPAGDLFMAYQSWAAENGISKTMSQKGLRDRLTRLGFGAERDRSARYVTGLRVERPAWGV
ncbi:MAG: bifunctional DNA primase/polymerase [Marinibacterium sp.]|nr:bifunctional DNA primase/polymerase [Marinibacterium sp.]